MHKKNSFKIFQSTHHTPHLIKNQTRHQGTLYRQNPLFFIQSRDQRQLIRGFECLANSGNFEKMDIEAPQQTKKLSNSSKTQGVIPIHYFSNLVLEGASPQNQKSTFDFPISRTQSSKLSNPFFVGTEGQNCQGEQSFTESQRILSTNPYIGQSVFGETLVSSSCSLATPPEMSEQTLSNLRSRNILRFLFTVITGNENSGKTVAIGVNFRNLFSPNLFSQSSLTKPSKGSDRKTLLLEIVGKSKKAFWAKKSKRNLIWGSLTILTILGFPVVLGFTMRLTTSGRVQSPLSVGTGLSSSVARNTVGEKKSYLFNGLVPSPKFALGSFSRVDSTESAVDANISSVDFRFLGSSMEPIRENILRLPEYLSKLFIIWGLLYIWKGVRPQRKTFKDFHGDGIARVIWPNRPSGGLRRFLRDASRKTNSKLRNEKGAFSSLQGLNAFLPVLETLIQSLQVQNFKWMPMGNSSIKPLSQLQGRHPKGYLFVGPPGTGKTLLAQALASEAQVPLLCLSASEIQKQIEIGTRIGALRLRKLFDQARRLAPCILFLDEIDAIGKYRGGVTENFNQNPGESSSSQNTNSGSGKSSDLKLFTEFLIQMDECKGPGTSDGFVVIGTTNFLSNLDSAFIRSGRFDRILGLNYPAKKVRIDILKWYCGALVQTKGSGSRNLTQQDSEIAWNYFGHYTNQYSPADLARLVNESLLYQVTRGKNPLQLKGGQIHSFESLQKGFNRIQSHKKDLSGGGTPLLPR
jgi:hypothetical protein